MAPHRIHFLLPAIHGRPTGGNVYNESLRAHLAGHVPVVGHPERDLDRNRLLAQSRPGDVLLVDSLLLVDYDALRAGGDLPERFAVLVAHYLHVLDPRRRSGPQARRERERLHRFDGFVTTSAFAREALAAEGVSRDRVLALTPGVDARFGPSDRAAPHDPPRLLTVASLVPDKGLLGLLDLLESLGEQPWQWDVAGDERLDPAYAARFRAAVDASAVGARVRLHGPLPPGALADLYRSSDLLLHGSAFETCGMVVMEALASGLPVAAYRVGGLAEQVQEPASVVLAAPGDREALREGLRGVLSEPARLARMRAAARRGGRYPGWSDRAETLLDWLEAGTPFRR